MIWPCAIFPQDRTEPFSSIMWRSAMWRSAMRKRLMIGGAVLVFLSASAFGGYWWVKGRFIETTDDAYLQSDISIIAPKVAGYVKRIPVVENQHVQAGDVLVTIDDQ